MRRIIRLVNQVGLVFGGFALLLVGVAAAGVAADGVAAGVATCGENSEFEFLQKNARQFQSNLTKFCKYIFFSLAIQ